MKQIRKPYARVSMRECARKRLRVKTLYKRYFLDCDFVNPHHYMWPEYASKFWWFIWCRRNPYRSVAGYVRMSDFQEVNERPIMSFIYTKDDKQNDNSYRLYDPSEGFLEGDDDGDDT